jgi:methylenetetrahydrofolate dehydrogenase (NADP+)/methenyltetrahydrofolate cyclohydrolase
MDSATIINGKKLAAEIEVSLHEQTLKFKRRHKIVPKLAVVLVGSNPASEIYISNKQKKAAAVGIESVDYRLPDDVEEEKLINLVDQLNQDSAINGILVQLPLPGHIDQYKIINKIASEKDVDGFSVINAGRLFTGQKAIIPCTPNGCLYMIKKTMGKNIAGSNAVIIGRSNIVGKPMAQLLLEENCTVTIAHSKTRNLQAECSQADVIIAAAGKPHLITKSYIKPGAVVIDVGINRITNSAGEKTIVGDVKFSEVKEIAGAISPVPGGVGPMTVIFLLVNVLSCALNQNRVET